MARQVTVVINEDGDEAVIKTLSDVLRRNDGMSRQLRDFAATFNDSQQPRGLPFQPKPGQILICRFGLGFQVTENVKTRPVLVVSPYQRHWSGLSLVVPISSRIPRVVRPYHYRLPEGVVPGEKYRESWIKGDMVAAVGAHRLDRVKVAARKYEAPLVSKEVLKEARRCILHAAGMHSLTFHW